jgi:hypothetical protein
MTEPAAVDRLGNEIRVGDFVRTYGIVYGSQKSTAATRTRIGISKIVDMSDRADRV